MYLQQEAQKKRGGLSVCLKDAQAAEEFRNLHERCIKNMISTARAKQPKQPKQHKTPPFVVKSNIKKVTKRPILPKKNRG